MFTDSSPSSTLQQGFYWHAAFLMQSFVLQLWKKNKNFTLSWQVLASYSTKKTVAIWSITTCNNCSVSLTRLSLWHTCSDVEGSWQEVKTLEKICACNAARHDSFVTLPNQAPFSCRCVFFFTLYERKYLKRRVSVRKHLQVTQLQLWWSYITWKQFKPEVSVESIDNHLSIKYKT